MDWRKMGTEIYILVEVYDENKDEWVLVKYNKEIKKYEPFTGEYPIKNPNEDDEMFEKRLGDYDDNFPGESVDRNYSLFAVLADVRNNYNHGHEIITPLSLPRGFPKDVSFNIEEVPGYDPSIHSLTWYSIEELKNIDWGKINVPGLRGTYYMKAYDFNKYLNENKVISGPINKNDLCFERSKYTIKYAEYRQIKDEKRYDFEGYLIAFNYEFKTNLQDCESVKQLMEIVERVSEQFSKARLLFYFDN